MFATREIAEQLEHVQKHVLCDVKFLSRHSWNVRLHRCYSPGWRAFSPGQNYLLSATVGPTGNESIAHLSVAFWQFPPRDDGFLRNRQKSEVAMEPTRSHRMLQSVMTRRPRKVTSFVRSTEVHPQIAVYESQRMCRSCGRSRRAQNHFAWSVASCCQQSNEKRVRTPMV